MDKSIVLKYFEANRVYVDKKIKEGIEKNRKGEFELLFSDDGEKGVSVRQVGHKFRFGCNAFMIGGFESEDKEKVYRQKFEKLFNLAVVPFYWDSLEPQEGSLRFGVDSEYIYRRPAPDAVLNFCRQHGIEPKGHCLLWAFCNPQWLQKYGEKDKKRLVEKRFEEIAERYAREIPSFDVINESASTYAVGRKNLFEGYEEFALDMGAKYFPHSKKFLNETNDSVWNYAWARGGKYIPFYMQAEKLLNSGKKIDALGIQYHLFFKEEQMREEEILKSYLDPAVHFDVLETLGKLGLPMQISEVTVPSYFRSEEANAEIQAFITEELYRLWFSVENMEGVDYWNLVDGYATGAKRGTCGGENYYGGGLLDFDMNEKPAYRALDRLINGEWKTTAEGNGVKDSFRFRGFFGTYEIEVRRQGRTEKFNLDLSDSGRYAAGEKTAVRV